MRKPLMLLLALLLTLAWALPASGAVGLRLSLQQLAEEADRVVVARLASSESAWGPESRRIYTRHTFTVEQTLAGEAGERLVLVLPGGIVGEWGQRVSGVPSFAPDAAVVLFARGSTLVGLTQGAFALDPAADRFVQSLEGVHFLDDDGPPLTLPRRHLKQAVQALVGADR